MRAQPMVEGVSLPGDRLITSKELVPPCDSGGRRVFAAKRGEKTVWVAVFESQASSLTPGSMIQAPGRQRTLP